MGQTADEMSHYLAEAIRRSISYPAALPRHEEVVETTAQLRQYLTRLLPAAEAHVDNMVRGTPEWHHARALVDAAHRALSGDPGPGLRSAVLHMQAVGRACHHLRGVLPQPASSRCPQCDYIRADRREAEQGRNTEAMRDAATRMGVHLREAHP